MYRTLTVLLAGVVWFANAAALTAGNSNPATGILIGIYDCSLTTPSAPAGPFSVSVTNSVAPGDAGDVSSGHPLPVAASYSISEPVTHTSNPDYDTWGNGSFTLRRFVAVAARVVRTNREGEETCNGAPTLFSPPW